MKKFFFYAAALCMTAVGFTACTAEDEAFPAPALSVSVENSAVAAEGGRIAFNLTAPTNEAYSVDLPEWIVMDEGATVTRNVNTTSDLNFVVAPAVSYEERVGNIRITTASGMVVTHEVVQDGIEFAVAAADGSEATTVTYPCLTSVLSLKVTAADGYKVELPSWITMEEDYNTTHDAAQTVEVHFNLAPNATAEDRQGEILIYANESDENPVSFNVVQCAQIMKFTGEVTSLEYGTTYTSNIELIWDLENPNVVRIANIDPFAYSEGYTYANQQNYVDAEYLSDYKVIGVVAGSPLHVNYYGYDLFYASCETVDASDGSLTHGYYEFNEDLSTLSCANAVYNIVMQGDQILGWFDYYRGGIEYTRVTE